MSASLNGGLGSSAFRLSATTVSMSTYCPSGTDLSVYSQTHLNKVARQLNEQPRKTLEFETQAERFNACVASTG
jgi:IS30 family transposase